MCDKYVIGYWISEKKRQKFNWNDFCNLCEAKGFLLKMVNILSIKYSTCMKRYDNRLCVYHVSFYLIS